MRKFLPKLLTLICLLVAIMGLSVITAHAATVTGTISGGNEYRYHEDKSPVPGWGSYTSTKLKYFTPSGGGSTVPAYCMEPSVGSASGSLSYSSVSWSSLRTDQRYAITLAMAYGYGGAYGFGNIHPDCAQLATQAVIWEFVCDFRDTTYPYTLYDSTCAGLFHYAGDGVAAAYDMIIDRIMSHETIPSFAVKYQRQLSDANAIELTWNGSQYSASVTDTNGVLSEFRFTCNISGVNITQRGNTLTVTATKAAAAQLNGYISSDYGYSLDVNGDEAVLLEPSNGSNYQACTALTEIPDPVVAYIHFKVKVVEEKGSLTINKTDADTGKALAGVTYWLYDASGNKVADVTTGTDGMAVFSDLPLGSYSYQEISAPSGYVVDNTKYPITITSTTLNMLGKLLYFSLPSVLVDKDDLRQLCADMNIPYAGGNRLSVSDAFRSATGDVRDRIISEEYGERHIYQIYCRDNRRISDSVISRELVKETMHQETNQYEKLANISYDKDSQIFSYDNLAYDSQIDAMAYCRRAEELFELYQRCANRRQVETICVNFLRMLESTKLSVNGHLYFVPRHNMEKVDIFEDFVAELSRLNRNQTHLMANSIYIIDDAKQRQKMTEEFYSAVKKEIAEYQERADYFIKSGCQSPSVMDRWVLKIQSLEGKKRHYEDVLRRELDGLDDDFATLKLLSQELSFRAQAIRAKKAA